MNKRALSTTSIVVIAIIAYLLVFELPYLIPPVRRVASDSYAFGFNNIIAVLGVVIVVAILVVRGLMRHDERLCLTIPSFSENTTFTNSMRKSIPILFALLYSITTIGLVLLVRDSFYGEAAYFSRRIALISMGLRPYRDFEFAYGPALIYLPALGHTVLGKWGGSVDVSYYLCYGLTNLFGLYLLYYTVNSIAVESEQKNVLFATIASIYWFVVSLGLNYTFLRFLLPYACLIVVHQVLITLTKSSSNKSVFALLALCVASSLLNLSISPEIGLAYIVSLSSYVAYFASSSISYRSKFLAALLVTLITVLMLFVPYRDYYQSVFSFGTGGNNFPVVPAPHILIYLFGVFFLVPAQLISAIKERCQENSLTLAFASLSILTLAGALGRCDFGHVLWYGLGVFLTMPVSLLQVSRSYFRTYILIFILLFACYHAVHLGVVYRGQIIASIRVTLEKYSLSEESALKHGFSKLDRYEAILTPLGSDPALDKYLKSTGKFVSEYFVSDLVNVFTEDDVERKLHDLEKAPLVLIRKGECNTLTPKPPSDKWLRAFFLYPGTLVPKRERFDPRAELLKFICGNYQRIDSVEGYELMSRVR